MKKVLIAGGSGQIGIYLSKKLIEKGYRVSILSKRNIYFDEMQTLGQKEYLVFHSNRTTQLRKKHFAAT